MAGTIEEASFDEVLDRLMGYYDRLCSPLRGPGMRLAVRLARYRLSWLAFPWMFVETILTFFRAFPEMRAYESAAQAAFAHYQLLTGKEAADASDEVTEITSQLAEIDGRFIPHLGLEDPPFADEPQLRMAAAVLLRFYAENQVTDDQVFAATQTAYLRLEAISERGEGIDEIPDGRVRRQRQELDDEEEDARCALIRSWRRWFELRSRG